MLVQAPIAFAKPSADFDFTQIERADFEQQAYFDGLAVEMPWSPALKFKTEKLYDAYVELSIIEDGIVDLERHVQYLTQNFATTLRSWSVEVANSLMGTQRSRYKRQSIYGNIILNRLANKVKFRSPRVKTMFESLLPKELDRLEDGLKKEIKELQRQAGEAPLKPVIHLPEVAISAMLGQLTNYFLPYLHVPNNWSLIAGLLTFTAFYKYLTAIKGKASPVDALQIAIKFHNDIECENMLEFSDSEDLATPHS